MYITNTDSLFGERVTISTAPLPNRIRTVIYKRIPCQYFDGERPGCQTSCTAEANGRLDYPFRKFLA